MEPCPPATRPFVRFIFAAGFGCALALPCVSHAAGIGQTLLTAVHDTYVQRGTTTDFGAATTFLVKRDGADFSGGSDRIGYLRFAIGGPLAAVDSASLLLTFTNYPGDGTTPFTFEVFGLPDGHPDEAFDESLLNFSNATNASTTLPGSLNPAGLTSLGTFTPAVASGTAGVEFTSSALRDFIAANGNTHISLVVFRQTPNSGFPSYFASSENANLSYRPTLVIRSPNDAYAVAATTASSAASGFPATNATDNLFTTRWSATADTSGTKSSITLDLGSARTVNRLNFITYQHGRTYRLESSPNNSTWTSITDDFRSGTGTDVNTLLESTNLYFQPRSARYFRLTSQSSLSGKSVSMWEIQLFNDAAAATILARIGSLRTAVTAIPTATPADRIKRAVLDIALERAQASINTSDFTHAGLLMDDVDEKLPVAAATMAAQTTGLPNMRVLRPLLETTTATNPYLKRINDGVNAFLLTADTAWEKNTPQANVLEDFSLARTIGQQMDALFWAFAHPDSPLKNNDEVLRRLLRRTYAYLDAINVHGPLIPAGQLASFYDDFAIAPASSVFREFPGLYPGLVPTNSAAEWDGAMEMAAQNLWAAYQNRVASWVNTDVAIACELFNFGTWTSRPELLAKAQYFIDSVLTMNRMFEDGAVGYIGTQNETVNYQATVSEYVSRYFETTGDANAALILQKMQWFGAINGRIGDWWTAPSWKHAWNDIRSSFSGGETVAGMNPYVRAELDAWIATPANLTNWYGRARVDLAWYQTGTTPLTRPDYTVFDRNTQGPRAWYGRWNYSATLRNINLSESGHATLIGAQVADPDPDFRVNASLMGIYPRLRVSAASPRDADGSLNESAHAWLTSGLTGDSTVSRDFSTIGASYGIHQFGSSVKGATYDWTGRQVWLNLPDRIIGLMDLAPNADLTAFEVQGVIRLGFGGTSFSSTKTLVSTGADSWSYGDLRVKLHSHNYAEVSPEIYTFRNPGAPYTEITLRDRVDGATNITPVVHTAGTRRKFIAEIRPASTSGEVTVTEVAEAGGLIGLEVSNPATGRKYRVVYNPGTVAADYTPALGWTGPVRIHRSGARHRPDWLPDPSGPLVSSYLTNGQVLTIQPKAHLVLEQSIPMIKANNVDPLDQSSSWNTSPLIDGSIATWNSTVTSANATTVGKGKNLAGISITDPGGNVTISPGTAGLLAIGSAGIDTTASVRTLALASPVRLDASQSWTTGSSGLAGSTQIAASGVVSGAGALAISATAGRGVSLTAANTFSGGCTLGSGAILDYSAAAAFAAADGVLTSSALGTGPLTIQGGTLVAGNRFFFNPSVAIQGDFTWSTASARVDTSGAFDLGGGVRTLSLTRPVTAPNVVVSGGNNSIRFIPVAGGIAANSFTNGTLRLAVAASVAATDFVVATFGNSNRFTDNAGLVVGPRVYISPSFSSTPFGSNAATRPAVSLEAGALLSLSDGGSGRGHSIFSLAGGGTVLNNTSGTAERTDTLTIDGGIKTGASDFSGSIMDTDLTRFPTANPNLKTGLTKTGATTQVLSGASSYSGPTSVTGGVLTLTGSLGNTSALDIEVGARFENLGSLTVTGNITNDGTLLLTGTALLAVGGTFTNNGVLDIRGWSGSLPNGLVNNGTILSDPSPTLDPAIFTDWQALVWPGTTDPETIGPDADPDGDGRKNSLEWALLLDPKLPDVFTPGFILNGGTIEITYTRRKVAPGEAGYQVEWSDTLGDEWSDADVITDPPVSLSTTGESVRSSVPAGSGGRRFVRVRITLPDAPDTPPRNS
jgi:autotransporter-associated beta strand protein